VTGWTDGGDTALNGQLPGTFRVGWRWKVAWQVHENDCRGGVVDELHVWRGRWRRENVDMCVGMSDDRDA